MWYGTCAIRAMAVQLGRDHLVFSQAGVPLFYPKESHAMKWEGGRSKNFPQAEYLQCFDGKGWFLPAAVFEPQCVVVVYDGSCHYWCTRFTTPKGESHEQWLRQKAAMCSLRTKNAVRL